MKKLLLCSICALFLGVVFYHVSGVCIAYAGEQSADGSATKGSSKTESYGKPQESIEAAQKYVKNTFFYSTRKDDKVNGVPLTNTTEAMNTVKINRDKYYEEVVSFTYGQASEELTTGTDQAKATLNDLVTKAGSAQTYDEKKAVGVLIANASVQARIKRLSLDLALLELEAVALLKDLPENYIIARTPEEIDAEVAENIKGK